MDDRQKGISLNRFSDFQLYTAAVAAAAVLGAIYLFLWPLIPAIGVVWFVVRFLNEKDDPRNSKSPPDDP